jgi:hypothetical protein
MFESAAPEKPSRGGGPAAIHFLGQQILATIGSLVLSYPIFRAGEMEFLKSGEDDAAVWAWRWVALLIPVAIGFVLGFCVQGIRPSAYVVGRFVAIIPTLWFIKDFASAISSLTFSGAVATTLRDAGGLEMWVGAVFYSIGLHWRHRREMGAC